MATTRIAFSAATTEGKQVAEFIDAVMDAAARARRLKAQFLAMNSDTTAIEGELGMTVPGAGNDLWYILNIGIVAVSESADVAALERLAY